MASAVPLQDVTGSSWRARWRARRARLVQLWTAGLIVSLSVTAASSLGYLESLQARTLDLIQWLGAQRFPSEIVIVAIDDAAFESLGGRQPLPREYLAKVIRGIQRSGASAVGLDIRLSSATTPDADEALARVLRDFSQGGVSQVVGVDVPPAAGPLADPALLGVFARASERIPMDSDGVIRRAALLVPRAGDSAAPTLSFAVLSRLGGRDPRSIAAEIGRSAGPVSLPVWEKSGTWGLGPAVAIRPGELWRINFVGPRGSFLTVPSDAVAQLGDPGIPVAQDNPLRGRVVFVGATFQDSLDIYPTPQGRLPGVEIHANLAHMLATRTFIRPVGWLASLAMQVGIVVLAALFLTLLRPLWATLAAIAATLSIGVPASYLAFHSRGYAVDFLLPVLATCGLGLTADALARRRIRDSFGRYVGHEVMKRVLAEDPTLRGGRREVTILVSDIRGFTTLSETLPAEVVATHLNEYFPPMVGAIFACGGMVNDFIGDGILAIFGAPLSDPEHALHAARSAVAMEQALEKLNREWSARDLPTLRIGVGIHTGVVFAGNIGGPTRFKYTVIGDTVNVAARLEGLNKDLGTTILVTEETRLALGDKAETRPRGDLPVKGRARPLQVSELIAIRS